MRKRPATPRASDRSQERPALAPVSNRVLLLGASLLCAIGALVVCVPEQWVEATDWNGGHDRASRGAGRGTAALSRSSDDFSASQVRPPLAAELSDPSAEDAASTRQSDALHPSRVAPSSTGIPGNDPGESSRSTSGSGGSTFGFDFFAHIGARAQSRPSDGRFVDHHPDGGVAIDGLYENGERAGEWDSYYPDGSLRLEGQYADGKRVGKWKAYHPNGQPMGEGEFSGGLREGTWVLWYSNGLMKEHGVFEHDLRNGPWQYYDNFNQLEPRSGYYRYGRLLN